MWDGTTGRDSQSVKTRTRGRVLAAPLLNLVSGASRGEVAIVVAKRLHERCEHVLLGTACPTARNSCLFGSEQAAREGLEISEGARLEPNIFSLQHLQVRPKPAGDVGCIFTPELRGTVLVTLPIF